MATEYSPELMEKIISRLEKGEPLAVICRDDGMPGRTTVYAWKDAYGWEERFARAREIGFDAIAESCFEIADDARNDWMERKGKDGQGIGWFLNGDHVQRSKLRIWTRMQLLAKWDPKRYGEKIQAEHTGKDGAQLFDKIVVEIVKPEK